MLSQYHIRMPRAVYGGENAIESLTAIIEACQAKQVVIFTDKGIRDHGLLALPDILRGAGDTLVAGETVAAFAARWSCRLWTVEGAEHWFHTPPDLAALSDWLRETNAG